MLKWIGKILPLDEKLQGHKYFCEDNWLSPGRWFLFTTFSLSLQPHVSHASSQSRRSLWFLLSMHLCHPTRFNLGPTSNAPDYFFPFLSYNNLILDFFQGPPYISHKLFTCYSLYFYLFHFKFKSQAWNRMHILYTTQDSSMHMTSFHTKHSQPRNSISPYVLLSTTSVLFVPDL